MSTIRILKTLAGIRKILSIPITGAIKYLTAFGKPTVANEFGTLSDYNSGTFLTTHLDYNSSLPSGMPVKILTRGSAWPTIVLWSNGKLYGIGIAGSGVGTLAYSMMPGADLEKISLTQWGATALTELTLPSGVTSIIDGDSISPNAYAVIIGDNGRVYGSGMATNGGMTASSTATQRLVLSFTLFTGMPADSKAIKVACGINFTIVLLNNFAGVYYTGKINAMTEKITLTALYGPEGVSFDLLDAANTYFICAKRGTNLLYYCGATYGVSTATGLTQFPKVIPNGLEIIKIAAGYNNIAVLASDGNVYGCGENFSSEITGSGVASWFKLMIGLPIGVEAVDISFSRENFCIVVGSDGVVYHTGSGAGLVNSSLTPVLGLASGKYANLATAHVDKVISIVKDSTPAKLSYTLTGVDKLQWVLTLSGTYNYVAQITRLSDGNILVYARDTSGIFYYIKIDTNGEIIGSWSLNDSTKLSTVFTDVELLSFSIFPGGFAHHINTTYSGATKTIRVSTNNMETVCPELKSTSVLKILYWTDNSTGILYEVVCYKAAAPTYSKTYLLLRKNSDKIPIVTLKLGKLYSDRVYDIVINNVFNAIYINGSWDTNSSGSTISTYLMRVTITSSSLTITNCVTAALISTENAKLVISNASDELFVYHYNALTSTLYLLKLNNVFSIIFLKTTSASYPAISKCVVACNFPSGKSGIIIPETTGKVTCFGPYGSVIWIRNFTSQSIYGSTIDNNFLYLLTNTGKIIKYDYLSAPVGNIGDLSVTADTSPFIQGTYTLTLSPTTITDTLNPTVSFTDVLSGNITLTNASITKAIQTNKTKSSSWNIQLPDNGEVYAIIEFNNFFAIQYTISGSGEYRILTVDLDGNYLACITIPGNNFITRMKNNRLAYTTINETGGGILYVLDRDLQVVEQYSLPDSAKLHTSTRQWFCNNYLTGDYYIAYRSDVAAGQQHICIRRFDENHLPISGDSSAVTFTGTFSSMYVNMMQVCIYQNFLCLDYNLMTTTTSRHIFVTRDLYTCSTVSICGTSVGDTNDLKLFYDGKGYIWGSKQIGVSIAKLSGIYSTFNYGYNFTGSAAPSYYGELFDVGAILSGTISGISRTVLAKDDYTTPTFNRGYLPPINAKNTLIDITKNFLIPIKSNVLNLYKPFKTLIPNSVTNSSILTDDTSTVNYSNGTAITLPVLSAAYSGVITTTVFLTPMSVTQFPTNANNFIKTDLTNASG